LSFDRAFGPAWASLALAIVAIASACRSSSTFLDRDASGQDTAEAGRGDRGVDGSRGGDGERGGGETAMGGGRVGGGLGGAATKSGGGAGGGQAGAEQSGGAGGAAGQGPEDRADGGAAPRLRLNDVTILVPLPRTTDTPVLLRGTDLADDGTALVPRALFDRLTSEPSGGSPPLQADSHTRLQLVAVRFDLCDRQLAGPCASTEEARMRLVFQPISAGPRADDVGFHAFYAIRNDEIPSAVATLRDLAQSAWDVSGQDGALQISPALSAAQPSGYAAALRAFVKRYGGTARLIRLTVNMQPQTSAQIRWTLRGVEKRGEAFVDMTIAGTTATTESVVFGGTPSPSYTVNPAVDLPAGLSGALNGQTFGAADLVAKRVYLTALVAAENPLSETAVSVPCVACHVSTIIAKKRADDSGIDLVNLPGRFTSTFDLSVAAGKLTDTPFTIRALGYFSTAPMISQRVVNETAQTLVELNSRHLL